MKKFTTCFSLVLLLLGIAGINTASALDFGDDITVFDGVARTGWGSYTPWWNNLNEDQEVEHGNQLGQEWDLEGMFLNGTELTLVGGYDFQNGHESIYTGDIFIDVDGNMTYGQNISELSGNGYKNISNVFGYDYVIDMTFDAKKLSSTYNVYKIDETAVLSSPYYRSNDESGAHRYVSGGELVGSGSVLYQTELSDTETGFIGGNHNALTVDLGFLEASTDFTAHYTMGCGNDDLIGKGFVEIPQVSGVPEPGTVLLLGGGLLGLFVIVKKRHA